MVSTFTPNINLEEPARGDDVGTWDTPVNNNTTALDLAIGGITSISLNNSNVVLSASQLQSKGISFGSTLTGSVTITFATSFKKSYEIFNACTGSSAFTITLQTTASGGELIGCPPGEWFDVVNDGTNLRYKNFGRIGEYLDYGGSSNPAWNTLCTKPPYLLCDGSAIPAAYTALPIVLGSSVLPDSRGLARYTLNQGTGRLVAGTGGIDGNTKFTTKTSQTTTIGTANLPPYTPSGSVSGTAPVSPSNPGGANAAAQVNTNTPAQATIIAAFAGNAQGGTSTPLNVIGTAYIGGITLIRAG